MGRDCGLHISNRMSDNGTKSSRKDITGKTRHINSAAWVRDRRLLAKLVPTFAVGCRVVSVTDSYGRILGFLERSRYFFFQVVPQLYFFLSFVGKLHCSCFAMELLSKSKLLYDWLSVSQSVSQHVLVSSTLVWLATRYYFLSECCCLKFAVLFLWDALSDERTGLQFALQSLNGPSRSEPAAILYCLIWDSTNLKGQVPVFISPRNRVTQLCPRALGSLYVVSYDSSLDSRLSRRFLQTASRKFCKT
jgi:hypothetical protein